MLVTDEAGIIIYANREAERFYEEPDSGLLKSSVVKLLPDWFSLPTRCRDFPTRAVLRSGQERPVTLSLAAVQTPHFAAIVAIFRDSSSGLAGSERLLVEKSQLRALVLERDIASMRSELGEAAKILEHHLPTRRLAGVDLSWIFEPCQTLGGDMVFVHQYGPKVILGLLDVSGHGVAASLLAIGLSRSLSPERGRGGCILGRGGVLRQPMDIVARLNQDSHTLFESGLFVTLLFGILDLTSGELCFTCAGHPLPLRVWRGRASQVVGVVDQPLGVEKEASYSQTTVNLRPGELLALFTDGVTECRSPSGELFGEERLMKLVSGRSRCTSSLSGELRDSLRLFRGGRTASDDVSFLAIRMPAAKRLA